MDKLNNILGQLDDLENLGDGGDSIHKFRPPGEIVTAIKLFPAVASNKNLEEVNYSRFQTRLTEIASVTRTQHPHVVQFLSSGIAKQGNRPFIEMELVDGPHLDELQKTKFQPVFPLKEILKVAEHLSAALAHWHKAGVVHGAVKSRNVKYHDRSGNYILVNFGWAIPEQQPVVTPSENSRSRNEIAPEQTTGRLLVQTDIYHFGVVMFQLVLGQSFFQSEARANTANTKQQAAAYLGTPPHEFLTLRKKVIPLSWPKEKVQAETVLPEWFVLMIYKCLDKDPEARFDNGMLLHQYILENSVKVAVTSTGNPLDGEHDYEKLLIENLELKKTLEKEKHFYKILHGQWKELNDAALNRKPEPVEIKNMRQGSPLLTRFIPGKLNRRSFIYVVSGVAVVVLIAAFMILSPGKLAREGSGVSSISHTDTGKDKPVVLHKENSTTASAPENRDTGSKVVLNKTPVVKETAKKQGKPEQDETGVAETPPGDISAGKDNLNTRYKVRSKAYFYNLPYEETRRKAFIVHWNNAILSPLEDKNGFIYIVFTNHLGQTSRGWLRKKDLSRVTQKG